MSNQNVWKTNWTTTDPDDESTTTNYRSIRNTGNRYSRYAPHNDKNTTQNILQRAKLNKAKQDNNGYGHNTYHQGLPFNALLQTHSNHEDDDDNDIMYHRQDLLNAYNPPIKPHPNLSNITLESSTNTSFIQKHSRPPVTSDALQSSPTRFPQNNNASCASPEKKAQNNALSSTGKWRSRRAEKLKKNPHQKHPYSSNPIPSNRDHTEHSNHEISNPSPTTYKDSRFTRFAQEQQQLSSVNTTTSREVVNPNTDTTNAVDREQDHTDINALNKKETPPKQQEEQWFYKDPSGQEQGPFDKSQMGQWFKDGYFPQDLPIRCNEATPFVQLKDWFSQGMTAFLEEIPMKWPQTNEQVVINANSLQNTEIQPQQPQAQAQATAEDTHIEDIESDIGNKGYRYEHNTPPSSDNEEQEQEQEQSHEHEHEEDGNMYMNDRCNEETTTNKSSIPDSFYDPNQTRMASIHPRPVSGQEMDVDVNVNVNANVNMNMNVNVNVEEKMNMNQDEALDYYLDNKNEDNMDEYDYDEYNKYSKYDYDGYNERDEHSTPPPMNPRAQRTHSYHQTSTNKLTPVSAYDRSLAATPPAQKTKQHQMYPYHRTSTEHNDYDHDEEYNYTSSTNPEHNEEDHSLHMPLFRSNTDPTDYHHVANDPLPQSTSDPNDMDINHHHHHHHHKNVYDPFGAQDLFANGRRHLTQIQRDIQSKYGINNNEEPQSAIHRKYTHTHAPTRQPMKRINNDLTPNTKQQRDRKPPIRHKWPHHFMGTAQIQFEEMMVKPSINDPCAHAAVDIDVVPTKPPHHSNVDNNGNNNSNERTKKNKTRKRRKKKTSNKQNKTENNHNNASNVWGSHKTKQNTPCNVSKPSFTELQKKDEDEQQQIKRKQREDIKRRQDVIKQQKQQQLLQKQQQQQQEQQQQQQQQQEQDQEQNLPILDHNPWGQSTVPSKSSNKKKKNKDVAVAHTHAHVPSSSAASWSSRATASASASMNQAPMNQLQAPNTQNVLRRNNSAQNNNNKARRTKQNQSKPMKNRNNNGNKQQDGNNGNNKNIDSVNKVSAELQSWLRTEIRKLNPDVETVSVAHLLLTLDDNTAKTTAYHTFGNSKEVNTFIDSFLMHRSHDFQQQKNKGSQKSNNQQKKKKGKKTRR